MTTRVFFFLSFLALHFAIVAQDSSNILKVKHHLLQRNPDELQEVADSFRILHLVIGGNIYQTEKHLNYAYDVPAGPFDFKDELKYIQPVFNIGDISIANLKTSFANDSSNVFSAPDEFAAALKYAGISALMHANQSTANINKAALLRTRELLNTFDINHTGAFLNQAERLGNYPLILHKKGFTIAVLNYTTLLNRPDVSKDFIINESEKFFIDHDMVLARANKPDFIIVYFNWGDDAHETPSAAQHDLAQYVFERGANIVVGTAPNKPMPVEYLNFYYNGKPGEGIVAYSMGNIVSSNEEIKNRNGYVLDINLKKNGFTGQTKIDDWGVIPVYTYYDTTTVKNKTKVYSLPCWAVENGDVFQGMPYIEKRRVINGAYQVRQMLGSAADEIQYNLNEQIVNNVMESVHLTRAPLNNKFSQLREEDIKLSPAPLAVTYLPGSNIPLSLAMVTEQTKPKEEPVIANKTTKAPPAPTAYQKEKSKAANVFDAPLPPVDKVSNITAINTPKAIADTATASVAKPLAIAKKDSALIIAETTLPIKSDAKNIAAAAPVAIPKKDTTNTIIASPVTLAKNDTNNKKATIAPPIAVIKNDMANANIPTPVLPVKKDTTSKTIAPPVVVAKTDVKNPPVVAPVVAETKKDTIVKHITQPVAEATKDTTHKNITQPVIAKNDVKNAPVVQPPVTAKNDIKTPPLATAKIDTTNKNISRTVIAPKNVPGNTTAKQSVANPKTNIKNPTTTSPVTTAKNNTKNTATQLPEPRKPITPISPVAPTATNIANSTTTEIKVNLDKVNGKQIKLQVDTFYRIQFYALAKYVPLDTNYYTHLKGYQVVEEKGLYKYLLGKYKSYNECYKYWKGQIQPRYKQSFIIKYIEGKRVIK